MHQKNGCKSSTTRQRRLNQRTPRSGFTVTPRGSLRNVDTDDEDDIVTYGHHHHNHNHHHNHHHTHHYGQDYAAELAAERAVFSIFEDTEPEDEDELARLQQEQEQLFAESRRAVGYITNDGTGRSISVGDTTHQRPSDETSERTESEASQTDNTTPRPGTDDEDDEPMEAPGDEL